MNLKQGNGITLVALIITITVMLILVGVTLNIELDENGIIEKTKQAKEIEEDEEIKEILQAFSLGHVTKAGVINLAGLNAQETNGYNITYTDGDNYATATNGEKTFYINEKGEILKDIPINRGIYYNFGYTDSSDFNNPGKDDTVYIFNYNTENSLNVEKWYYDSSLSKWEKDTKETGEPWAYNGTIITDPNEDTYNINSDGTVMTMESEKDGITRTHEYTVNFEISHNKLK